MTKSQDEPDWLHWGSYGHALGMRLRAIRRARGLSQNRLAELAGVSRNLVSNIERNENTAHRPSDPQLSTLYRLAYVLAVPPGALFPAAADIVSQVCPSSELEVNLVWPAPEQEIPKFTKMHLALAEPGDQPVIQAPEAG